MCLEGVGVGVGVVLGFFRGVCDGCVCTHTHTPSQESDPTLCVFRKNRLLLCNKCLVTKNFGSTKKTSEIKATKKRELDSVIVEREPAVGNEKRTQSSMFNQLKGPLKARKINMKS